MGFNKKFFTTGGIVASTPSAPAAAAFDAFQNFETVTYTGNGGTQKITGYIRKGASFNGSSSYISADNILDTSSAFTYSLWINPNTISTLDYLIGHQQAGSPYAGVSLLGSGSNKLFLSISGGTAQDMTPSLTLGSWSHIVLTHDGSGNYTCYTNNNGSPITYSGATSNNSSNPFRIGFSSVGGWGYFDGKVDQVRIFNTELNSTQVEQLADEEYGDAENSVTDFFDDGSGVALYELDEDALSSNFEQGVDFNGIAASNRSKILTSGLTTYNDFSISFWMNSDDFTYYRIMMGTSDSYNTQAGFGIMTGFPNNGDLTFRASAGSGGVDITATGLSDGTWYHVVITQDSSTTTKKIYINGTLEDTDTTSTIANGQGYSLILGGYSIYDNNPYDGTLDQIRIYSSALDQTDVTNLYRENNIPTTNLVTHYTFDNTYTDQVGSNNGTASNTTFVNGVYGGTPTNVNFLGMAFQPDFVWIKNRDASYSHMLYDSIRGAGNDLSSDTTSAEGTVTGLMTSFDTNGFTVVAGGSNRTNFSGEDYVAWCWKAGGSVTPNNNTDGDITSTVSANQDAGFSIVKYTGNLTDITTATGASVGHGLSSTPELIMFRNLSTVANWGVYSSELDNWGTNLHLNTTDAKDNQYSTYPIADPTQDIFYTNYLTAQNVSGYDYVAYCFHSVDGYQKVGSYTGSGVSGKRVYTTDDGTPTGNGGFRPRFVMYKLSSSSGHSWVMIDDVRSPSNPRNKYLFANESNQEGTSNVLNFTDNGFELLITYLGTNALDETYIYLAIA